MNKQQVVDYLYEIKKKLEEEGYVPTIELVIDDLETKIAEEKEEETDLTHNAGHDDEWTEKVVHEEGDFSGASDDNGEGR
jgi:phage terminase small subunit